MFVERQLGIKVDAHAMFDVQIKRLHEYKRQTLNILGVIHVCIMGLVDEGANTSISFTQRYLLIKNATPEERKKFVKKVVFFAGKAAPGCTSFIHLPYSPLADIRTHGDYIAKLVSTLSRVIF